MDSMFLTIVIGWYMVIFGALILIRHSYVKSVMADILVQRGLFFILAIITLILGLLLVASHNIWIMGWTVIITVFGWMVLIGGLFRLFFPEEAKKLGQSFLNHPVGMKIAGVVFLIFGVVLLLHVYHFHL